MHDVPAYSFRTSWSDRDGECVATCDELPGLSGLAPTPARAIAELRIAIAAWLDFLAARGIPAPPPIAPDGVRRGA
jgi:predicted RNase H-like HicB family nuclease